MSENMRAQISGLDVAMRNSQDGISMFQTAEGALGGTNSMLQKMRELAVQASNDTLTSQDRQYLQLEIDELKNQIDRIADTTQFNKKRLLDGSCGAVWSSSDPGVKARIHGGLVSVDEFGQRVNHEGNYRIEVSAEPGQAQVQKSNIMAFTEKVDTIKVGEIQKISDSNNETLSANVVFVIDSSGSMGSELDKVKTHIETFKEKIEASGVSKVNIGVATCGSPNTEDANFVVWTYPDGSLWSSDISAIKSMMAPITTPYVIDTYNYCGVQMAAEVVLTEQAAIW